MNARRDSQAEAHTSHGPAHGRPRTEHGCAGMDRQPPHTPPASLTRRRFLRNSAVGAAGIAAAQLYPLHPARAGSRTSRVVRTFHPEATTGMDVVNQEPVNLMVDAAIRELSAANQQDPAVLYGLALAYRGKDDLEKARAFADQAANFNGINLELGFNHSYALVRGRAQQLLSEL